MCGQYRGGGQKIFLRDPLIQYAPVQKGLAVHAFAADNQPFSRAGPIRLTSKGRLFHIRFMPISISGYCIKQSSLPDTKIAGRGETGTPAHGRTMPRCDSNLVDI